MSLFKSRKKFTVSERDPVYKVRYLGNVQTSMMRGEGCVDKPTAVLWNNFMKTANGGLEMKLTISASGLKAVTKEQGLTEYRAHRISYCIAHPKYPKLFIWVYRHEGKKLKVELRCHAVLCKTDAKAKAMAVQLHDKLAFALSEFMREKCRRQNTRLALQRTNSLPVSSSGMNARNKFLSTGQNFKPPVDRSASAPKLGSINEDLEPEEVLEEEDEEEDDDDDLDEDYMLVMSAARHRKKSGETEDIHRMSSSVSDSNGGDLGGSNRGSSTSNGEPGEVVAENMFSLEVGNDVEELKKDSSVRYQLDHTDSDNDDDSSESGFSEQDLRESSSCNGSSFGSDPQLANGSHHCPLHPTNSNGSGGQNSSGAASKNGHECQCGQGPGDNGEAGLEVTLSPNISVVEGEGVATAARSTERNVDTAGLHPTTTHLPHHHQKDQLPATTAGGAAAKHTTANNVTTTTTTTSSSVPNGRTVVPNGASSGATYVPNIINERRF